jgi:Lipocalin-like domain
MRHPTAPRIRERLLGAWQLVSWSEHPSEGKVTYPLGEGARGQIIYSPEGRVAAQLMSVDMSRFAHEDWRVASSGEKAAAWGKYFGYFGTFSIDDVRGAVIHHIEGSWFPNLVGTDQVRFFRFEEERLVLDADTNWGKVRIEWEKISS